MFFYWGEKHPPGKKKTPFLFVGLFPKYFFKKTGGVPRKIFFL
ncbi:hypothetical protein EBI_25583 [Enterocytozoon bieneusi H348]|nr:hypothetical protein EBI_25583 [Enterocytozoon bieneusi H348]|eukprot:XP_002651298.1 hypothetical protein EBI_25583 [Enterocytozoon bieneusi H348]